MLYNLTSEVAHCLLSYSVCEKPVTKLSPRSRGGENWVPPFEKTHTKGSLVAQWVKDLALSLLWLRFDPRSRTFHTPPVQPKKKKKKENILKTLWMYVPSNRNCWSSRWATIPIACVLCSAKLRVWSLARAQQMKGSSVAIAVAWVTHGTWIWSLAQERHCHRWPKLKKQNKTKQAENLANVYEKQVYGKMEMFVNLEKEVIWNNIFF